MFWCCCGDTPIARREGFRNSATGWSFRFLNDITNQPYNGQDPFIPRDWGHQVDTLEIGTTGVLFQYQPYGFGLRYGPANPFQNAPGFRFQYMNWCTVMARVRANAGQTIQSARLVFNDNSSASALTTQPSVQVNVWCSRRQFIGNVEPPENDASFQIGWGSFSPNPFPFQTTAFPFFIPLPWANTYNTKPTGWTSFNGPWMDSPAVGTTSGSWSVDVTSQVQDYLNAATANNGYMLFLVASQHPSQVWYSTESPAEGGIPNRSPYGHLHNIKPTPVNVTTIANNYLELII